MSETDPIVPQNDNLDLVEGLVVDAAAGLSSTDRHLADDLENASIRDIEGITRREFLKLSLYTIIGLIRATLGYEAYARRGMDIIGIIIDKALTSRGLKNGGIKYLERLGVESSRMRQLEIETGDGVLLNACLLNPEGKQLVVVSHGWGGTAWDDIKECLEIGTILSDRHDCAVLFWDQRWHGNSWNTAKGVHLTPHFTFGQKESQDLATIIKYAKAHGSYERTVLWGRSGGAAISMLQEETIDAIFTDSLFADLPRVFAFHHALPSLIRSSEFLNVILYYGARYLISLAAKRVNVRSDEVSIVDRFKKGKLPRAGNIVLGYSIFDQDIRWQGGSDNSLSHGRILADALVTAGLTRHSIDQAGENWRMVDRVGEVKFLEAGDPELKSFALNYPGANGHMIAIGIKIEAYVKMLIELGIIKP